MLLEITTIIVTTSMVYKQLPENTRREISEGVDRLVGTCCRGSNGCLEGIFLAGISLIQGEAAGSGSNFNEISNQAEISLSGLTTSQQTE